MAADVARNIAAANAAELGEKEAEVVTAELALEGLRRDQLKVAPEALPPTPAMRPDVAAALALPAVASSATAPRSRSTTMSVSSGLVHVVLPVSTFE